jgi:hypothetical protein
MVGGLPVTSTVGIRRFGGAGQADCQQQDGRAGQSRSAKLGPYIALKSGGIMARPALVSSW